MRRCISIGQLPWNIFAWCSTNGSMGQPPRNVAATWQKRWSIHKSACICIFQHIVCRFQNDHQRRDFGASCGCGLEICGVKRGVNSGIMRLLKSRQFTHKKLTTTILSRMEATPYCRMCNAFSSWAANSGPRYPSEWQQEGPFSFL